MHDFSLIQNVSA